jgi:hypothetical protein
MVKLTYSSDISDSVGVGGEIVKSASELKKQASTIFNKEYDELKPPEGKTGIHLVALGAMETYGFNRNADGFKQADCRDRCDTFVKHGHVYQHHRNKDPEKALGEIKCAAYNPDMDRVELYIWADNEKAKDHLERLEKTGEVSFSMACQVPSDTCSLCGATRKGPGDPNECEHIKYQLGKIAEDGKFIGMINNEPRWFDISFVGRPADRIAWSLKTASGLCDSVKQAEYEGVVVPDELAVTSDRGLRKLALMKEMAGVSSRMRGWLKKASFESGEERRMFEMRKLAALSMPDGLLNDLRAYGPRDTFEALADAGVVMDAPSFFKYAMGPDYRSVRPYVPEIEKAASSVLEKAVSDGACSAFCNSTEFDAYDADDLRRKPLPTALRAKLAEYGCDDPASKIMDITLTGKTPTFSVDGGQENSVISVVSTKLAEKYLTYKLAAVDAVLNSRYGANRNKNNLAAISAAQDLKLGENDDK